ncbi:MAG: polysaccharide biosynthesis protein [Alphaproteobacteria bacterium]|nr:MAG: polysaccharide biosynthesis protein [Alphaproteobacteria bacterium]
MRAAAIRTAALRGVLPRLGGDGLGARAIRSALLTLGGFGASQALRLASNLILTRLLFPEAFGLMALVQVFITGLAMFSDVGITPAIMQSRRGDDPVFLNTAWTIQVFRGFALWVAAALLALPVAWFYDEPRLAAMLPVAALGLVISGFNPTTLETARRHLRYGRITLIDLASQLVGIGAAVGLALALHSVWALVFSGLVAAAFQLWAYRRFLPGGRNRLGWERDAVAELIGFGRWIFLSTIAGFVHHNGDRLVLGRFVSLAALGLYNIGFFLASVPMMVGQTLAGRLMIPLYRELAAAAPPTRPVRLALVRGAVSGGVLAGLWVLGLAGPWLVGLLYDPRYAPAGAVVVLVALAQIPSAIQLGLDQVALAAGDSARFFRLSAIRASLTLAGLIGGAQLAGLGGAIAGMGLAALAAWPALIALARAHAAWDRRHDSLGLAAGAAVAATILWVHGEKIAPLFSAQ